VKTAIIAVSKRGIEQAGRLKELYPQAQIYVPARFINPLPLEGGGSGCGCCPELAPSDATAPQGLTPLSGSFSEAVAGLFENYRLLIFITATAVAVRAIAPCLKSKAKDPAVVVIDEQAKFAISLLSGHLGGANEETEKIARCLGAQPVITTATDNQGITAFDDLARKLGWQIENLPDLKKISAALLEEREIFFYSDYPFTYPLQGNIRIAESPEQLNNAVNGYVLVSSRELPLEFLPAYPHIILRPPVIAAGMGCRRGIPAEAIIGAVESAFSEAGLSIASLACLASGEFKADEEGLIEAAKHFGVELKIFTREEIAANLGDSQLSNFVQDQVGVGAVAEPCARLGASCGELLLPTIRNNGITIALAHTKP
jgi:cobalt-precorrin 5A hydrolase